MPDLIATARWAATGANQAPGWVKRQDKVGMKSWY